jgi:hypothetical protein
MPGGRADAFSRRAKVLVFKHPHTVVLDSNLVLVAIRVNRIMRMRHRAQRDEPCHAFCLHERLAPPALRVVWPQLPRFDWHIEVQVRVDQRMIAETARLMHSISGLQAVESRIGRTIFVRNDF